MIKPASGGTGKLKTLLDSKIDTPVKVMSIRFAKVDITHGIVENPSE